MYSIYFRKQCLKHVEGDRDGEGDMRKVRHHEGASKEGVRAKFSDLHPSTLSHTNPVYPLFYAMHVGLGQGSACFFSTKSKIVNIFIFSGHSYFTVPL